MKQTITYSLLAGALLLSACKKDFLTEETVAPEQTKQEVINVPEAPFAAGFNFNTTKDVKLNVTLRTNTDAPLAGVVVNVYLPGTEDTGEPIYKGVTDNNGLLDGKVTVAASVETLVIDPAYIGLIRHAQTAISGNNVLTAVIGGKSGFGGDVMAESVTPDAPTKAVQSYKPAGYQTNGLVVTSFVYPGSYTSSNAILNNATYPKALGRPAYLETTGDNISAKLLSYVNTSLPENKPVTTAHPQYLATSAVSTLDITNATDVYVTFVSEGAATLNSLAYYTYPTGNPPATGVSLIPILNIGIDKVTYVFPNASANGSGGGLRSGDKVKLGTFAKGTSVAFLLIQNGWTGSDIDASRTKFYSTDKYNFNQNKQSVVLYDSESKKHIVGFEDISRSSGSDNDFNDLVITATSSVAGAISTANVPAVDTAVDTDGDGVLDVNDAFPNDATRAFVSFYPSASTYGTLAFEDSWPRKGDYDMNDMVVSYRYTYECNASNQVVAIKADYAVLAAGTGYKHGFGVELPVAASAVSSVTGQKRVKNYITMASNGVEAGQAKAVIIPFDSQDAMMPQAANSTLVNTVAAQGKESSLTASLTITFASPVTLTSLAVSSFNPFIIASMDRGREVHLMGYRPTSKANTKLFDTEDDATVPAQNKYYQSLEGRPFAIMFSDKFLYPVERINIDKAYNQYNSWAVSSGGTHTDWYSNSAAGYRNALNIYNK